MGWFYLTIAGVFEIIWAVSLKHTYGFTRLWPSIGNLFAMFLGVGFLSKSLVTLPVGTAYASWTGIGVIGTTVLGIILFKEPRNWYRIFFIFLILLGIAGLRLTEPNLHKLDDRTRVKK